MKSRHLLLALTVPLLLSACMPALLVGGAAAGAYAANDRRAVGRQLDDTKLESLIDRRLNENFGDRIHVNVTAYDGVVLLTGEVPDAEQRKKFSDLVKLTPNARRIVDEVRVAPLSTAQWRLNDTAMTTKVKSRLAQSDDFNIAHVKVVTEANDVYLLGRVTQKEADAAIEIARNTRHVNRVVSVFDIVGEDALKAADK